MPHPRVVFLGQGAAARLQRDVQSTISFSWLHSFTFMSSASPTPPVLEPTVARLARLCGRTLLIAFGIIILGAALPLQAASSTWGTQFSSIIVDSAFLALLGVAMLGLATPPPKEQDYRSKRRNSNWLIKPKDGILLLCRAGVVGLVLLAVWQIPLMMGSIAAFERQIQARAGQLNERISQGEQTIRRAPAALIQREWQRLAAARAPGISPEINDPEKQRQLLLKQVERQQQQLDRTIGSRDGQGRFLVMRNSLRIMALCAAYITGFLGVSSLRL